MSSLLPSSSPAWLAPVWEERSHSQGTMRWVPCSSHRAIVGTCASADCAPQDGLGETVDLEEDHPGDVRAILGGPAGTAPDQSKLSRVVVDAERGGEQHQGDGEQERHQDGTDEIRGVAVHELDRDRDDRGVQDQRAEAEGQDGEREEQPDQEGPQQRVEHSDQGGDQQDGAEAGDLDSRHHGCESP